MKVLIYDLEIINCVPGKDKPIEGIKYCQGWHDHAGMGISVIGAFDYSTQRYRVFLEDNFTDFILLARNTELLVTFNGIGFDNKVVEACIGPLGQPENYDLMAEMMVAADTDNRKGFSLDATCKANFGFGKSMDGGLAPVNWQEGRRGTVIDYCLNDVRLTKVLFDRVKQNGGLRDPRDPSEFLEMRKP
jgi:hypothetical protein